MSRCQFLVDLRNHILLKWVQSQNPQHPRNAVVTQRRTTSINVTISELGATPLAATHPDWKADASYTGPGARFAPAFTGLPGSEERKNFRLPLPLRFTEVIEYVPERYHEIAACIFDFLEARGKINFGAIRLSPRLDIPSQSFGRVGEVPLSSQDRKKIVVVGAGIAGLAAARQLMQFGHEVVIIEGRDRPGGRICTNRQLGISVDEGAMITTGDEPNPFSLLVRQLGLRQHVIRNMQTPLLLPRKYFHCVYQMARERTKYGALIDQWRMRYKDVLESIVAGRGDKRTAPDRVEQGVQKIEPTLSMVAKPQFYPGGRTVFGVELPPELAHLDNEVVKHAVRIQSAHTTLIHTHLEFLKRLYRILTAVAMAEAHHQGKADSLEEGPTYGILHVKSALSAHTIAQLDAVFEEVLQVTTLLRKTPAQRTIDLLNAAMKEQASTAMSTALTPSVEIQPSVDHAGTPSAEPKEPEPAVTTVDDASLETPFIVSVPIVLDSAIEKEFNALMDAASALKQHTYLPSSSVLASAFPLIRAQAFQHEALVRAAPVATADGWTMLGNEVFRKEYDASAPLEMRMSALQRFFSHNGSAIPGIVGQGLPVVDPQTYRFDASPDNGVNGVAIQSWCRDVVPRRRLPKFVDPRRTDDDIDGVYDGGAHTLSTAPSSYLPDKKKAGTTSTRSTKKSASTVTSPQELLWPNHSVGRRVYYGRKPEWDLSIAEAIDLSATIDDSKRRTEGWKVLSSATAEAIVRLPRSDAAANRMPGTPLTVDIRIPQPPDRIVSGLEKKYWDTDGLMALGSAAAIAAAEGEQEADEDVDPALLTYPMLRRSVLRWHTANLEYGCARPMDGVSLQQWDQDDVFNYHDRGQHYFVKDGYDTHIRGMLQDVPVVYSSKVTNIRHLKPADGSGDSKVQVEYSSSLGISAIEADAVIVTCPVGVLQRNEMNFEPQLPAWKMEAIHAIGSGLLNKVILQFPTAFWRQDPDRSASEAAAQTDSASFEHAAAGASDVDSATSDLLAGFGWGNSDAAPTPATADALPTGHSAARARAGMAKAAGALAFPAVHIVSHAGHPDEEEPLSVTPAWVSHLFNIGYLRARSQQLLRALEPGSRATSPSILEKASKLQSMVPTGNTLGREPHRICSFVPFMEFLRGFHLQPATMTDSQLMTACALALRVPSKASLRDSPYVDSQRAIFTALHAVLESRGDMQLAANLLVRWQEASQTIAAKFDGLDEHKKILAAVEWEKKALMEETPPALSAIYETASQYASHVFALPKVTPSPFVDAATGEIIPPDESPQHVEEPELEQPASPPPTAPALLPPPVPVPAPAPQLSPTDTAFLQGLVPPQFGPASSAAFLRAASPLLNNLSEPSVVVSFPSLDAAEDSFGRVVLGESLGTVRRRGEAYMFWCMDRYGTNAKVCPTGKPSKITASGPAAELTSPVLIAMMAGEAAEWVERNSDETVSARVVTALKSVFGEDKVPLPVAHQITRWRGEEFSRGSYSFLKPGSHGAHYDMLAMPINDIICFAGEATNRHHPTTAAGAFDSGIREAVRLSDRFGRTRDPDVIRLLTARAARFGRPLPPNFPVLPLTATDVDMK
jgi:monoamine oxidase